MSARDDFLAAYNDPSRCFCGRGSHCENIENLVDQLIVKHARELGATSGPSELERRLLDAIDVASQTMTRAQDAYRRAVRDYQQFQWENE